MRPIITLVIASLFVGSCACDKCSAQVRRTTYGQYYQPQYVQPYQPPRYVQPQPQYVQPQYVQPQVIQAQPQPRAFDANKKVTGHDDGAGHLMYRSGQTIDLPTGRDRLHLTVALPDNFQTDPAAYRVASWFTGGAPAADGTPMSANARIRQIQQQCAWHYIFVSNPNWRETVRQELLGNGLTVMLTGPDGKIMQRGDGGLLMGATELASIKNADEMADYILAASEKLNAPPQVQGVNPNPVSATKAVMAGTCEKCGTYTAGGPCPNCTPAPPSTPPNSGTVPPKLSPVKPRPRSAMLGTIGGAAALGVFGLAAAGLLVVAIKRPGLKGTP
jgi:hypothetical protein